MPTITTVEIKVGQIGHHLQNLLEAFHTDLVDHQS